MNSSRTCQMRCWWKSSRTCIPSLNDELYGGKLLSFTSYPVECRYSVTMPTTHFSLLLERSSNKFHFDTLLNFAVVWFTWSLETNVISYRCVLTDQTNNKVPSLHTRQHPGEFNVLIRGFVLTTGISPNVTLIHRIQHS